MRWCHDLILYSHIYLHTQKKGITRKSGRETGRKRESEGERDKMLKLNIVGTYLAFWPFRRNAVTVCSAINEYVWLKFRWKLTCILAPFVQCAEIVEIPLRWKTALKKMTLAHVNRIDPILWNDKYYRNHTENWLTKEKNS